MAQVQVAPAGVNPAGRPPLPLAGCCLPVARVKVRSVSLSPPPRLSPDLETYVDIALPTRSSLSVDLAEKWQHWPDPSLSLSDLCKRSYRRPEAAVPLVEDHGQVCFRFIYLTLVGAWRPTRCCSGFASFSERRHLCGCLLVSTSVQRRRL